MNSVPSHCQASSPAPATGADTWPYRSLASAATACSCCTRDLRRSRSRAVLRGTPSRNNTACVMASCSHLFCTDVAGAEAPAGIEGKSGNTKGFTVASAGEPRGASSGAGTVGSSPEASAYQAASLRNASGCPWLVSVQSVNFWRTMRRQSFAWHSAPAVVRRGCAPASRRVSIWACSTEPDNAEGARCSVGGEGGALGVLEVEPIVSFAPRSKLCTQRWRLPFSRW